MPLATLQTQGKLIKTRATKDKDGMLHSTTFEVVGKLCLIACAYSEKSYDQMSLPFLCLHLNHSPSQDLNIMEYQKKFRAGLINQTEIAAIQRKLKCVLANLQNVSIINPFAPLIQLPEDLPNPRKTLLLLLNFIDIITYFHQHQREQSTDKETGEIFTLTHPNDIELAFSLLKGSLFRRVDELSTTARGFYNWLKRFLEESETNQFTALDIRKAKRLHPRTLNNYLNELKLYSYVQVVGGNKHREGFIYKLTDISQLTELQNGIEESLKKTMQAVRKSCVEPVETEKPKPPTETKPTEKKETEKPKENPTPETDQTKKDKQPTYANASAGRRIRINDKEKHTLKLLLELEAKEAGREYLPKDFTAITGRHHITEARHLKTLCEQGKLTREWRDRQYYYRLAKTFSQQVSQTPLSNSQTQAQ